MRLTPLAACLAVLAVAALSGCSLFEEEERLEGERLPVRQAPQEGSTGRVVQTPVPAEAAPGDWTQSGGGAAHAGGHLALDPPLDEVWRADAGAGAGSDTAITAAPIVAGGRVFALDAEAGLSAFDAGSGAARWRVSLVPEGEEDGAEGFGGGLAAGGGRVFATTGFGEVIALAADSGEAIWRRRLPAPFRSGPALGGGRLVAVTRDGTAYGLDAADGSILWRQRGVAGETAWLGGASPLIAGGAAVVPFPSGELVALQAGTGRRGWSGVMTGGRRGFARSAITELTGQPVLAGDLTIAANQSGRIAAFDGRTGRRVWTRAVGATRPLWAAGDTVWLVSDLAVLMRLDAGTGETLWQRPLERFEDMEDREDPILYSGPVLAGGRIWLTDSLERLHAYDALTGEGGPEIELPGVALTGPVVAGGRLYLLTRDAELVAYR